MDPYKSKDSVRTDKAFKTVFASLSTERLCWRAPREQNTYRGKHLDDKPFVRQHLKNDAGPFLLSKRTTMSSTPTTVRSTTRASCMHERREQETIRSIYWRCRSLLKMTFVTLMLHIKLKILLGSTDDWLHIDIISRDVWFAYWYSRRCRCESQCLHIYQRWSRSNRDRGS